MAWKNLESELAELFEQQQPEEPIWSTREKRNFAAREAWKLDGSLRTKHRERARKWRAGVWATDEGRQKLLAYQREYRRQRYANDPEFRARSIAATKASKLARQARLADS
jgi:hypothetical protein